ncbi:MAG: asparaginase [Rhodospirillales bacterium]|nr:MAG: asparaginase [Rhodospirillales bacterium]
MAEANPVLVAVTRGDRVESAHRGAAAVVDAAGALVFARGDVETPIFPRSAVKPLQVLPLLETGAADRFAVTEAELALACASHAGEPEHVSRVAQWLDRLGLSESALVCGPHPPLAEAAAHDLISRGESPSRLHNNCSGKHTGFLATALHLREPTTGYAGPVHPVQLRVRRTLAHLGGCDLNDTHVAADGCGVPTLAMPLQALARALALLAAPAPLGRLRALAARRVVAAMTAHPFLVGGSGRFDTAIMEAAAGSVMVKAGAEGVHAAAVPALGLGIAVKIDDGARRAADAAMAALLLRFAQPGADLRVRLVHFVETALRNTLDARIGTLRVMPGWLED